MQYAKYIHGFKLVYSWVLHLRVVVGRVVPVHELLKFWTQMIGVYQLSATIVPVSKPSPWLANTMSLPAIAGPSQKKRRLVLSPLSRRLALRSRERTPKPRVRVPIYLLSLLVHLLSKPLRGGSSLLHLPPHPRRPLLLPNSLPKFQNPLLDPHHLLPRRLEILGSPLDTPLHLSVLLPPSDLLPTLPPLHNPPPLPHQKLPLLIPPNKILPQTTPRLPPQYKRPGIQAPQPLPILVDDLASLADMMTPLPLTLSTPTLKSHASQSPNPNHQIRPIPPHPKVPSSTPTAPPSRRHQSVGAQVLAAERVEGAALGVVDGAAEAVADAAGRAAGAAVAGEGLVDGGGGAGFAGEGEFGVRGGFDGGEGRVGEGLEVVAGAAGPVGGEDG